MSKLILTIIFNILIFINPSRAQTSGCTDPLALNYNLSATINDGSCIYSTAAFTPFQSFTLNNALSETSGIILWDNQIFNQNDNDDISIYGLDTLNGNILQSYRINGTLNNGWEELSQDDSYVYIGDFGNNVNGNRTDLKILKIGKNSVLTNSPVIETINFSYSDQVDFSPTGSNNTDFDCEAFITSSDSIFLFTKQWISNKTSVYSLPKTPGTFIAKLKSTYNVQGLITGSTFLESKRLIALSGYSHTLDPFVFLLYDFRNSDFFSGNKRKISFSMPFHQVEGIATADGLKYYMTNEKFAFPPYIDVSPKLHIIDLSPYLKSYLESLIVTIPESKPGEYLIVYPVPACNILTIKINVDATKQNYYLINVSGQIVLSGKLSEEIQNIEISELNSGFYLLKVGDKSSKYIKVIKK